MPPTKSGDFAWVQHMIMSMTPRSGRMAVVLPHGALFRMGAEGKIRQNLKASWNAACQAEDILSESDRFAASVADKLRREKTCRWTKTNFSVTSVSSVATTK
jgi:hypothetical protein